MDELAGHNFDKFINTINKEQARDLVRNINLFMKSFRAKPPDAEADSKAVQDFLASMAVAFAQHPLWAGASREDLDAAAEGLEKYLMTKLFDRTFGMDPLDRERDAAVEARLRALAFVRPEHLEVPAELAADSSLLLAQKELARINMFKSPRDKLVCILSCCKVVNNLLASKKHGAGADDFTPVLIYVTIKAAPHALPSNLSYIERYRAASRLVSEAQYFFVQMQSALTFIETLDIHGSLKVDPDELIAHMLAAGALTDTELAMMQTRKSSDGLNQAIHERPAQQQPPPPPPPPPLPPPQSQAVHDAHHSRQHSTSSIHSWQQQHVPPPPPPPMDLMDFSDIPRQHSSDAMVEVVDNYQNGFATNPLWQARNSLGSVSRPASPLPPAPPPPHYPPVNQINQPSRFSHDHPAMVPPPPPPPPPPPTNSFDSYPSQQLQRAAFTQQAQPGSFSGQQGIQTQVLQGMTGWAANSPNLNMGVVPPPPPPPPPAPTDDLPRFQSTSIGSPHPSTTSHNVRAGSHPTSSLEPSFPTRTDKVSSTIPVMLSVQELEAAGADLLLKAHASGQLQAQYPLLYANADTLPLGQVKPLLEAYKEIVLKYEALSLAVTQSHQQQASLQTNRFPVSTSGAERFTPTPLQTSNIETRSNGSALEGSALPSQTTLYPSSNSSTFQQPAANQVQPAPEMQVATNTHTLAAIHDTPAVSHSQQATFPSTEFQPNNSYLERQRLLYQPVATGSFRDLVLDQHPAALDDTPNTSAVDNDAIQQDESQTVEGQQGTAQQSSGYDILETKDDTDVQQEGHAGDSYNPAAFSMQPEAQSESVAADVTTPIDPQGVLENSKPTEGSYHTSLDSQPSQQGYTPVVSASDNDLQAMGDEDSKVYMVNEQQAGKDDTGIADVTIVSNATTSTNNMHGNGDDALNGSASSAAGKAGIVYDDDVDGARASMPESKSIDDLQHVATSDGTEAAAPASQSDTACLLAGPDGNTHDKAEAATLHPTTSGGLSKDANDTAGSLETVAIAGQEEDGPQLVNSTHAKLGDSAPSEVTHSPVAGDFVGGQSSVCKDRLETSRDVLDSGNADVKGVSNEGASLLQHQQESAGGDSVPETMPSKEARVSSELNPVDSLLEELLDDSDVASGVGEQLDQALPASTQGNANKGSDLTGNSTTAAGLGDLTSELDLNDDDDDLFSGLNVP